jgi:hypothetical protein
MKKIASMGGILLVPALLAGILLSGLGCQGGGGTASQKGETATDSTDPASLLLDQLRGGSVQAQGGVETLSEADELLKSLLKEAQGDEKTALQEVEDLLVSGADACAEYGTPPPTLDEVRADFARHDEQRLAAITALNDALMDLKSAHGAAASLAEADDRYSRLEQILQLGVTDLEDAIAGYGGKVEEGADEPPSGP